MSLGFWRPWLLVCLAVTATPPALADEPTFASLLARAQEQAAEGHRWSPPGDNVTETVADMMGLISTATPDQLNKLAAILEDPADDPPPTLSTEGQPTRVPPNASSRTTEPAGTATVSGGDRPARVVTPAPAVERDQASMAAQGIPTQVIQPVQGIRPGQVASSVPGIAPAQPAGPNVPPTALLVPPTGARGPSAAGLAPVTPRPVVAPPQEASVHTATPYEADGAAAFIRPMTKQDSQISPATAARVKELFTRGQAAEHGGDVSGARRYYATAALHGDATAARNLGRLYDPAYLTQTAVGGIDPNPDLARHWYEQAAEMGDVEAGPLLKALSER